MDYQRTWEIVSEAIPIHILTESIDVPYETVLGINLYQQLLKYDFSPNCVEYLKKKPKNKENIDNNLSLYDIFCAPNMSDYMSINVFDVKLESLNIWVRYDFESYIMVAAIVSISICITCTYILYVCLFIGYVYT